MEGQDFLQAHCFDPDPDTRATAVELLKHPFIKVMDEYIYMPNFDICHEYIIYLPVQEYIIDIRDLEFGDCIDEGSFATVYSGKWLSKDMEVAIKKVRCEPSESEVKIWSSLSPHPNIIAFYGYARTSHHTYLVTELAENGSLYDRLHSQQENQVEKPTQRKCLAWAKEIAQGMAYLHRLEIIYRDLKSRNVLLTAEDAAKLSDFGTARYLSWQDPEAGRQGTYRWMAPEVIDGGSADKHSDVYSFSMVMWELMAHKIPFHDVADERDAAILAQEEHRPPLDNAWPLYIRVLIQKCWNHHPHCRPSFDDIVQYHLSH